MAREISDSARMYELHARLRQVRRMIAQTARALRSGADVGKELDALLSAESDALTAINAANVVQP